MTGLISMALSGAGIALVPSYLCAKDLQAKRLVRVLPGWEGDEFTVSLVSTSSTSSIARVKVVAEAVSQAITASL